MSDVMLPRTRIAETTDSSIDTPPSPKPPSSVAIWLGLADNSYTRQKTVKFGDPSAVNSGRAYSLITLFLLLVLWYVSTKAGWVRPIWSVDVRRPPALL